MSRRSCVFVVLATLSACGASQKKTSSEPDYYDQVLREQRHADSGDTPSVIDAARLPDGSVVWAGSTEDDPYLAQYKDGAWTPIEVPAELRPTFGDFQEVTADAQGNLYVSIEDRSGKLKVMSVIARVGGAWSKLGTFQRGWTSARNLRAVSPTEVYMTSWLMPDRRDQILRWDGTKLAPIPLPEGAKDIDDLALDKGTLVAAVHEDDAVYRLVNGTWSKMGKPAEKDLKILLEGFDGSLWRVGRVVERWTGTTWESPAGFTMPEGFEITDAAIGPKNELLLVLENEDDDDHLALLVDGKLQWHGGSVEKANYKYSIHAPIIDGAGNLHAHKTNERGQIFTFGTERGSQTADTGYQARDLKAAEVYAQFHKIGGELKANTTRYREAQDKYLSSRSEADYASAERVGNEILGWYRTTLLGLVSMSLAPKENRLYDALVAHVTANRDIQLLFVQRLEARHKKLDNLAAIEARIEAEDGRTGKTLQALLAAEEGYAERNGL